MVELLPLELDDDLKYIKSLLKEFYEKTGSLIAKQLIETWPEPAKKFVICTDSLSFLTALDNLRWICYYSR